MSKFWKKNDAEESWGNLGTDVPSEFKAYPDAMYIAAAEGAAVRDKQSRAYDDFLFSEDGLPKMPFEDVVDSRLALTSNRLVVRRAEALRKAEEQKLEVKATVQRLKLKIDNINVRRANLDAQLEHQREILEGSKPGHHGAMWPGQIPDTSSYWAVQKRLLIPILLFLLVGCVDLGIIVNSFTKIHGFKFYEAILFTAPALGVQLVFPHFIGERLGEIIRGAKHKGSRIAQVAVLGIAWLLFCSVMTEIRMNYIRSLSGARGLNLNLELALYAVNVIMLLGLGTWLMLSALQRNHHETEYAKIAFAVDRSEKKLTRLEAKIAKVQTKLPLIEEAKGMAEVSFDAAIKSAKIELADATKAIYRHALVNAMGDVEFTNSYLRPENGFSRKR